MNMPINPEMARKIYKFQRVGFMLEKPYLKAHGNIKNTPARNPDESGLGMRRFLEMQTTKSTFLRRNGCCVLNESTFKTKIPDNSGVKGFDEHSPAITIRV